eukprot:GHVP01025225.1.p1 GENE.GHVP01025225.1~~GHVP01025225.1.p1  ORF type:complete len:142 (-),score=41.04 GHVP01025225.1:470-895(-)
MEDDKPREQKSDKPTSSFYGRMKEEVISSRDPRFNGGTVNMNTDLFKKRYSFLQERQEKELKEIKKQIRKDPTLRDKGKVILKKFEQIKKGKERNNLEKELVRRHIKEDKQKQRRGKKPYYLKRSDKRELTKKTEKNRKGN